MVSATERADTATASAAIASGPTGAVTATEAADTVTAAGAVFSGAAGSVTATEAADTVAAAAGVRLPRGRTAAAGGPPAGRRIVPAAA